MSAPVLKKIHTFAEDLNTARNEKGLAIKSTPKLPTKSNPVKQEAAVRVTQRLENVPKKVTRSKSEPFKPSANDLPATIITDQKAKRFSLTTEMSSAIGEWWNEKVKSVKKKPKKNLYGLPLAERRKGIITAATTYTGRQETNDYQTIVKRVKEKAETTTLDAAVSKDPSLSVSADTPTTLGWDTARGDVLNASTANQEDSVLPVIPTLVEDNIKNESLATDQKDQPQIRVTDVTYRSSYIKPTLKSEGFVAVTEANENETIEARNGKADGGDQALSETSAPIKRPEPRTVEKVVPVIPLTSDINSNALTMLGEIPAPTLQNKPDYVKINIASRKEQMGWENSKPKKVNPLTKFAPYLAGGLFVLITVGGITYFMLGDIDNEGITNNSTLLPTNTNGATLPSEATNFHTLTAPLSAQNKTELFNTISTAANTGEGLQMVTPLAQDSLLPLTNREILNLLNRQFLPAFVGNVTNIQLGMYREKPMIVISVNDVIAAKGSMFLWETTMSQDLSPWFGAATILNGSGSASSFIDSASVNGDVRVLKDDTGSERIVYGFTGQSSIIITTDSIAFLNIIGNYNITQ